MNQKNILTLNISALLVSALCLVSMIRCSSTQETKIIPQQNITTSWADMALYVTKNTPANSPTYASRAIGYIGVTMYESVVHGYPEHMSLVNQLNELQKLPAPQEKLKYDWEVSLNAGQAEIIRKIYNQTSDENKAKVDSLESLIFDHLSKKNNDTESVERSVKFGRAVADAIFEWSKTDGGHRGYLQNFDKKLVHPKHAGAWEPPLYGQSFSHYPLHPYWGKNRTFVKADAEIATPQCISYDQGKDSKYYEQFKTVYEKNKTLTQAEKEAALWWGDDPGDTFTPPGHSYYLGSLVLKKMNADLITCAETYARIGIAVADAFIDCWKWKYHYFSERPSSYITKNVDERWESFWPDPPFPAFPSGHATQAAAVATVLANLFGNEFNFTDDAHVNRAKDELRQVEFKARSFSSFWQVAEETANSRFYGGIHTPQDNEAGLATGKNVGENVNRLQWTKNGATYAER